MPEKETDIPYLAKELAKSMFHLKAQQSDLTTGQPWLLESHFPQGKGNPGVEEQGSEDSGHT